MIYNRIINLCKQHNIKIATLLKELKIAAGSSTSWKKGTIPSSDALIKLAECFNVSIDYILFGNIITQIFLKVNSKSKISAFSLSYQQEFSVTTNI